MDFSVRAARIFSVRPRSSPYLLACSFILLLAVTLSLPAAAAVQGCSTCRDNVAGSAPKVQRGFRKAIPMLAVPAVAIFVGVIVLGWRSKPADAAR
jgi:hypothetical protein